MRITWEALPFDKDGVRVHLTNSRQYLINRSAAPHGWLPGHFLFLLERKQPDRKTPIQHWSNLLYSMLCWWWTSCKADLVKAGTDNMTFFMSLMSHRVRQHYESLFLCWLTDWQHWIRSVIIWHHPWSCCLSTSSWVPRTLVKECQSWLQQQKHCVWSQQFSALKRRNKDRGPVPVCHKEGTMGCPSFSQNLKVRMW